MEDILSYMKDLTVVRMDLAQEKAAQMKKAEEDKLRSEEMRKSAMEGLTSE